MPANVGPTLARVPKRTNLFQDVVAIVYEHLAGAAVKEESAMLVNRLTGAKREVDVVLRSTTAGHETVIAIEAAGRTRRAAVDWVEQMIGKHENLPTDKVVLVSEAGFTEQAKALAAVENMVTLTPTDLTGEDPAYKVVNAVPSLWPKTISLSPDRARVWVDRPGEGVKWFRAPADLDVFRGDGEPVAALMQVYANLLDANFERVAEQIGLADIAEDIERFFTLRAGPEWEVRIDEKPQRLYARWEDGDHGPELHAIEALEFTGRASIHVSEIRLNHKQLAGIDVKYAFGEGTFGGQPALVVVTEGEHGGKLTVRIADEAPESS